MLGRQSGPARRSQNKVTKKPGKKWSSQNHKKEDGKSKKTEDRNKGGRERLTKETWDKIVEKSRCL